MAIISLTTVPPRFAGLAPVLQSLLRQTAEIDEIRLYVPRRFRRFPCSDGQLPKVPSGVRVIPVDEDFGPASKVLHAARDLSGHSVPILFCDDDRLYSSNWAEGLLAAHRKRPKECIATIGRDLHDVMPEAPAKTAADRAKVGKQYPDPVYRMRRLRQQWRERSVQPKAAKPPRRLVARAGYVDLLQGYAGALVRADFFDAACFDIPPDVWMVDDIWLSGHLARRGVPIWLPRRCDICLRAGNDPVEALREARFEGADRDASNRRAIAHFQDRYGIWL